MGRATEAQRAEMAKEEKLQRALHENQQLKQEVLGLRDKLKILQVKFNKVTNDLKRVSPDMLKHLNEVASSAATSPPLSSMRTATSVGGAYATRQSTPGKRSFSLQPHAGTGEGAALSLGEAVDPAELQQCREALHRAQLEIVALRANTAATVGGTTAGPSPPSPAMVTVIEKLRQDLASAVVERDQRAAEVSVLRDELTRTRTQLEDVQFTQQQQLAVERHTCGMLNGRAQAAESRKQQLEAEFRRSVEILTRERDELALKLRLLQEEMDSEKRYGAGTVDPTQLVQVQADLQDKSRQITILTSRMQGSQQQVETLKNECSRLLDELQKFHAMHTETKRQLLELEGERNLLQVRCARVEELERTVKHKSEELIRTEQELLRTASTLQSCNRETEEAVRREFSSRLADVQGMRDSAEAQRREKERQLLEAQRELGELRRQLELTRENATMFQAELEKSEEERQKLSAMASVAGYTVKEFGDEKVRRALAVVAMRGDSGIDRNGGTGGVTNGFSDEVPVNASDGAAGEALEMWDALRWDEGWEAQQLREALASAALDMELAESRCTQMNEQLERNRHLMQQLSHERDALLEENIEMRRRLTHVQTAFAKQQLESYNAAKTRGTTNGGKGSSDGIINFCIHDLECNDAMLRALGASQVAGAAVTLFFSLDGLRSYDTMMSPMFYSLDSPLDIRFCYDRLDRDEATVAEIRATTFVFQLHQVCGTGTNIVAMGELPGVALLQARESAVLERVKLVSGSGEEVGVVAVEMCALNLLLPILLDRPLSGVGKDGDFCLNSDAVRAALVAMRSVVALRVQVFRADGLQNSPTPQPYVFYTAAMPSTTHGGISCIRDTVVHTSTKALTSDPVFDEEPIDHRVVVDSELISFVSESSVVFVVFDAQARDVRSNLGVAEVPLRPLLASPQAVIRKTEVLHPQGTLSIGLSWVCRS
ncbi:hypothetical protein, conserved [Trypanosoma brucei gambiense DAL972]|uniref:C2 domain-containing protein n=1 Tax=Trypanosoma brucei gambiense (strain MHOM/CI/86/DAL972) TaxID=679716 RepID=C9ZKP1_TRYB9|nr:hypothetical protein, conserved [Trypanosoma brucei gambiense DAL972]CBH10257.1 hypothetical protein, conserved [Trypanosoma brucei gambiense DAL972]|eukprot:XP_011772547.1 hypothetical protein, conserved [Trypanosoma brucei gambiense DAL972]